MDEGDIFVKTGLPKRTTRDHIQKN